MMTHTPAAGKPAALLWLLAVGVLSSAGIVLAAGRTGPTFDEPFYVPAGLDGWRDGTHTRLLAWGTMPLPADVHTLPLYLWERFGGSPLEFADQLRIARAANLVFWWLLLWNALRLGTRVGGPWAGRLALVFVASDPNLLGHAALATTDVPLTAVLLGLVCRSLAGGRVRAGVWLGAAVLAKASALLYGPVAMLVIEAWRTCEPRPQGSGGPDDPQPLPCGRGSQVVRSLAGLTLSGLVAAAVVLLYTGTDARPDGAVARVLAKLPPDVRVRPPLERVAGWPAVPNAAAAVAFQAWQGQAGRGGYLFGEWELGSRWYYFPAALAVKLPLPPMLLAAGLLLLRPQAFLQPPALVALGMLAAVLPAALPLGVRLVFPVVGVGYVALAVAAVRAGWPRLGAATAAAMVGVAVWAWPHGLTFANAAAGGAKRVHKRLGDSNADWGQGLPELARWHDRTGRPPLGVWYFGTDPAIHRPPFNRYPLDEMPVRSGADVKRLVETPYLAVGTGVFTCDPDRTPAKVAALAWLRRQTPVARTATFLIYDLRCCED
jgi:hypothetical protein